MIKLQQREVQEILSAVGISNTAASASIQVLEGVVSTHPRGFGFAMLQDDSDRSIFIPPQQMRGLVTGDVIRFTVRNGKRQGDQEVDRIRSVSRAESVWLGEIEQRAGRAWFVPDEALALLVEAEGGADVPTGHVVSVRLPAAEFNGPPPAVVMFPVEQVLGARDRAFFDQDYALARGDMPAQFSEAELAAAEAFGDAVDVEKALTGGWEDRRHTAFVTIDGESSRDLDDAVYVEQTAGKGFKVEVAIADVSAYVTPGSVLDQVAARRCTSVYLPGKTTPMLPAALSNKLCSLNAGVERLAVVCSMTVDREGRVRDTKISRAVIRSAARLTYDQVWAHMGGDTSLDSQVSPVVSQSLRLAYRLLPQLLAARRERGVLEFNDREPALRVREDGEFSIEWHERNDAHRLVEELMLLANQAVAAELKTRLGDGEGAVFRHQVAPDLTDWNELGAWLKERGVELPREPSLKNLNGLLAGCVGREDYEVIHARARKVMQVAIYDARETSHFSLGYEAYTHFTSPIRRYSDLLVHRILMSGAGNAAELKAVCARCADRSRAARLAERFVWDRIKKRLLVRDVATEQVLCARVAVTNARGAKVVFEEWQCAAFIEAANLEAAGFRWIEDLELWVRGEFVLEPGRTLPARRGDLVEAKSRCDLGAMLCA